MSARWVGTLFLYTNLANLESSSEFARMLLREKASLLKELLDSFPAVALLGPRQVGKTTLAYDLLKTRKAIYLDLESPRDLNKLSDPELYLNQHRDKLVILDEVHRIPEIFRILRGLIDQNKRDNITHGSYLLLGSASIELLQQSGESLAGRIAFINLFPFNLSEVGVNLNSLNNLWLRGGFPDSYLAKNDSTSLRWRENFITTYLERDIPQFGPRIAQETLRRFWTMLAYEQAGIINASKFGRNLGVDSKTIANYLDLLVDLLLVRRLQPWHKNIGKRLVKSPKIYVRDTGIAHALLNIQSYDQLLSHPTVGSSWEAFVVENVLSVIPQGAEASFYRSSGGSEIDLVISKNNDVLAIEIKKSLAPKVEKGFYYGCEDIGATQKYVVYPGDDKYPLAKDTWVMPLIDMMKKVRIL